MTRAGDQKKISGDTEHERETLSTGEGMVYMLHNVFRCCSQHTYMYARHLSVLVAVDTYGKHAYIHISSCQLNVAACKANFAKIVNFH